jgi:hypothetical protein
LVILRGGQLDNSLHGVILQRREIMEHSNTDDQLVAGEPWGGWKEIGFWVLAIFANGLFVLYAAWTLAVRHTEATGGSVLVPVKQQVDDSAASSSSSSSSAVPSARQRGSSKQADVPQ